MTVWKQNIIFSRPVQNVAAPAAGTGQSVDELLRLREEAGYQRGWTEGERALSEQLVRQRAELLQLQQGVLASLGGTMSQVKQECEQGLINLALEVASKLVAGLPVSACMIEAAVQEALAQVEEHTDYHVYLQPDDLDLLQQINSPTLISQVAGQNIHFHRAPELTRGSCMVRTRFGLVDATRETKLQLLTQAVAL